MHQQSSTTPPIRRKSRWGCSECKSRRIKCDELHPSCTKCSKAQRTCTYEYNGKATKVRPQSSPSESYSFGSSPPGSIPLVLERKSNTACLPDPSPSTDPVLDERYSLIHFRLLYHFEHELAVYMQASKPGMASTLPIFISEAQTTPYLIEQILAYSAAHKSTLDKESQLFYINEAIKLQTRALELYNTAKPEVTDETCLPMFLFSSLLCHHILFDVLNDSKNDLGAVLDGLTKSIVVHRGISAIAQSAWPRFSEELQQQFLQTCVRENDDVKSTTSLGECDSLLRRLDNSGLSPASIAVHRDAAELLQRLFDREGFTFSFKKDCLAAIQDWLIGVSVEFIQCLNQRRPEALVILAYYAVLLHRGAKYWFVGDLGRRLIQLIDGYLGDFWRDWLLWPNEMVKEGH